MKHTERSPDPTPPSPQILFPSAVVGAGLVTPQVAGSGDVFLAPLPHMITVTTWPAAEPGATSHVVSGGKCASGSWAEFCQLIETAHDENRVYPKGTGPHFNPTINPTGYRNNVSTVAVTALALDCDGAGDWHTLLAELDHQGVAYLAYRSGGHTPELPKWRIVLPFSTPYVVNHSDSRHWHRIYDHGRRVIGKLAGFTENGFDPATKAVSNVFYLGHRRTEDVVAAETIWKGGQALDLAALRAAAPPLTRSLASVATTPTSSTSTAVSGRTGSRRTLPADHMITLTNARTVLGVERFGSITAHSHCLCPEHGGSGGGTAWVDVWDGRPQLHCTKCPGGITWSIEEQIASLIVVGDAVDIDDITAGAPAPAAVPVDVIPDVETELYKAHVKAAHKEYKQNLKWARKVIGDLGIEKSAKCGFTQGIKGGGRLASAKRRCKEGTCRWCMETRLAVTAAAICHMPLLDGETGECGQPMAHRPLYMWHLGSLSVRGWKGRVERALCKLSSTSFYKPVEEILHRPNAVFGLGVQGYVIIETKKPYPNLPVGRYVLATAPHGMVSPTELADTRKACGLVRLLLELSCETTPKADDMGVTRPSVIIKPQHSPTLHLDPASVLKKMSTNEWTLATRERVLPAALASAADAEQVGATVKFTEVGGVNIATYAITGEMPEAQLARVLAEAIRQSEHTTVDVVIPTDLKPSTSTSTPLASLQELCNRNWSTTLRGFRKADAEEAKIVAGWATYGDIDITDLDYEEAS